MQPPAMDAAHRITWFDPDRPVENGTVYIREQPQRCAARCRGRRLLVFALLAVLTCGAARWLYSGWSSIGD